ncbi:MAG: phosphomethylpyrimidine synthase, partial [Frankiaceae bacterium]|nr:phosphomethylpyrimidine synthase [Frankiaceae bacterium]
MTATDVPTQITTGPITGSRKTHLPGPDGVGIPMREVLLTSGDSVVLYDTSGPYTDTSYSPDVRRGLPPLRRGWILGRGDVDEYDGRVLQPEDDGLKAGSMRNLDAVFDTQSRKPLRAR